MSNRQGSKRKLPYCSQAEKGDACILDYEDHRPLKRKRVRRIGRHITLEEDDERWFHPVTITSENGTHVKAKRMMLDTGATFTEISHGLAKRLGLYEVTPACSKPDVSVTSAGEYSVCTDLFLLDFDGIEVETEIRYPLKKPDYGDWDMDGVIGRNTIKQLGISIGP